MTCQTCYDPHRITAGISLFEAEKRAAVAVWGGMDWFLVNGTSGGVHAMLVAAEEGTARCPSHHLCVAGGLVLLGAMPCYVPMRPAMQVLPLDLR